MNRNISVVGGDKRIFYLIKMLIDDGVDVCTFGFEKKFLDLKINCNTLEEAINKSDMILSSIPLSQDEENVYSKYSDYKISIHELQKHLINKKFIAGRIPQYIKDNDLIQTYDILENEEYAILNAIPTAEGAIQIAIEQCKKTLLNSKILVMGFGRIGKIVSKMLQGIGAKVYCEARKEEDLAYIKAYGYIPIPLDKISENLNQFDIIINNIPVKILDKEKIDLLKKDVVIIDLASKPGGVDFEYARSKNVNVQWALALPGKVAPISSAEYIKDIIYKIV